MLESFQPFFKIISTILSFSFTVLLVKIFIKALAKSKDTKFPYNKKLSILTKTEKKFFRTLEEKYEPSHYIFCQVNLGRVINVTDQDNFYTYWNKINKKSIDFVLVDKENFKTAKLIELNDTSHHKDKRFKRDKFLKKVCDAAGLELEFVNANSTLALLE